jgi:hypothetical protein
MDVKEKLQVLRFEMKRVVLAIVNTIIAFFNDLACVFSTVIAFFSTNLACVFPIF